MGAFAYLLLLRLLRNGSMPVWTSPRLRNKSAYKHLSLCLRAPTGERLMVKNRPQMHMTAHASASNGFNKEPGKLASRYGRYKELDTFVQA